MELLGSLASLDALEICLSYNLAAIFEYLSARPEGEGPWTCPKLIGISVEYSQTSTYLDNLSDRRATGQQREHKETGHHTGAAGRHASRQENQKVGDYNL